VREPDEWHLGLESQGARATPPTTPTPVVPLPNLSEARLERPIYVVTAERLGWFLVVVYALVTRFGALTMRPLSESEARQALSAADIATNGLFSIATRADPAGGWLRAIEAGIFAYTGASDYAARVAFAWFALALVLIPLALRPYLGRAGSLGFAALLALSPTVTYFSRSTSAIVPAMALILAAIALGFSVARSPAMWKAIALGLVIAFALATDPTVLAATIVFVVILAILAIHTAASSGHAWTRLRVWWERRSSWAVAGVIVAVVALLVLDGPVLGRAILSPRIVASDFASWLRDLFEVPSGRTGEISVVAGLRSYRWIFAFYEFATVLLAAAGAILFVLLRIRSRAGVVAFLWTLFASIFFFLAPAHDPRSSVAIVVPAAMLAGAGVEWMHHTRAWRAIRHPIFVLAALTIYQQILMNFVAYAPSTGAARWATAMNLFAGEPATTIETPAECWRAHEMVAPAATVFFVLDEPVFGWYLRDLKRANDPNSADLIVAQGDAAQLPSARDTFTFSFADSWNPSETTPSLAAAIRLFLSGRAWSDVVRHEVRMDFRAQHDLSASSTEPTHIFAPAPSASPVASPAASTQASANASPSAAPSANPTPAPSPSVAEAAPTPTPAPPTRTPAPSASSTASAAPASSASATSEGKQN